MSAGLSYEAFAGLTGVARTTLYNWEKDHEEWRNAKARAFDACLLFWERQGIKGLWTVSDRVGSTCLNSPVWTFNMKNRFKWRDKQPEEIEDEARSALRLAYRLEDEGRK